MEEELYTVLDGNTILGSHMVLSAAMILIKGYFETYYLEPRLSLTIERMAKTEHCQNTEAADD